MRLQFTGDEVDFVYSKPLLAAMAEALQESKAKCVRIPKERRGAALSSWFCDANARTRNMRHARIFSANLRTQYASYIIFTVFPFTRIMYNKVYATFSEKKSKHVTPNNRCRKEAGDDTAACTADLELGPRAMHGKGAQGHRPFCGPIWTSDRPSG